MIGRFAMIAWWIIVVKQIVYGASMVNTQIAAFMK